MVWIIIIGILFCWDKVFVAIGEKVGMDDGFGQLWRVAVVVVEVEEDNAELGIFLGFNQLAE